MSNKTKLSSSTTVERFKKLEAADDREACGEFIVERFNERYFWPVQNSCAKQGFTTLAIACLVIETLESFYQGRPDTMNESGKMFSDFFKRDTELKVFADTKNWFYKDIRCGILHQAESRAGWRVIRTGPLLDRERRSINATRLLSALQQAVQKYAEQLKSDDTLWQHFRTKMAAVCDNCNHDAQ